MTTESLTPQTKATHAFPGSVLLRPFVWAGLAIPPLALAVELFSHACMSLMIDPIPSGFHAVLVALVPIATIRAHIALTRGHAERLRLDSGLLATACGVGLGYCVGMFPILAMASLAVVYVPLLGFFAITNGGGDEVGEILALLSLVPLAFAPAVGLLSTALYHWRLGRRFPGTRRHFVRFFGLGLGLFALAELPGAAAHYGLVASQPESRALFVLRTLATQDAMVRTANLGPQSAHVLGWVFGSSRSVDSDRARERYFRVTGEALQGAPPVRLVGASQPNRSWFGTTGFDEMQGGERVGRDLGDVHWTRSELAGELHPEGEFAYLEWTLEFRNDGARAREARGRLTLPPGAVVSRTTLWVNGQEREGAVGPKGIARAAYESVVRAQRDPLLVTTDGVDEVLVQCFPIPPGGGTMKIRLGITAPLVPHGSGSLTLALPRFVAQNFRRDPGLSRDVSLRSPSGAVEVRRGAARVARVATPTTLWVENARDSSDEVILQTWPEPLRPRSLIVVVDASQSIADRRSEIVAGLGELARTTSLELLLAGDEPRWLGDAPEALRHESLGGGQPNAPALALAIARMRERKAEAGPDAVGPALLWIHGPRPVVLPHAVDLAQEISRDALGPVFRFAVEPGPNRLWSRLALRAGPKLHTISRFESIPEDLRAFGRALESGAALRTPRRERAALAPSAATREPASRAAVHLTRLWAWEESLRFGSFLSTGDALTSNARASEIATRYELVTPWTGAVVLETDAEYPTASLPIPRREPDDPTLGDPPDGPPWAESVEASGVASDSPPPIPEPNTGLLVTLGIGLLALSRRRRIKR